MPVRDWLRPTHPPMLHYPFIVDFLDQAYEKPWFGKPHVRFPELLTIQLRLFETGAVIGRALRNKLTVLAKTFSDPGRHEELADYITEQADKRLRLYLSLTDRNPESLFDLFLVTELEGRGVPEDVLMHWKDKKLDLQFAYMLCAKTMVDGIGLGAKQPEMTELMWRNSWGSPDEATWDQARGRGLLIERPPTLITLEDRERLVLLGVTAFVATYHPDLMRPLSLKAMKPL